MLLLLLLCLLPKSYLFVLSRTQMAQLEKRIDELGSRYKSKSKRALYNKAKHLLIENIGNRKLDLKIIEHKVQKKDRKLMIDMILKLIKGAKAYMNPVIMPTLMPQVSDPRITIQTFNPPSNEILPPNLGPRVLNFNVKMPEIK